MSGATFTPGPWVVEPADGYVVGPDGLSVADYERGRPEDNANAHLIAAARDLIEPWTAADDQDWERLFQMLPDSGHGQFWKDILRRQRATIARAEGRVSAGQSGDPI